MSVDTYLDAFNEAMSMHAKAAVSNLNFNKTEIAEIVNITDRDKGDYIVDNGSVKYHAYIENSSYTLGTKVYVLIQNNDYSQRKLILGKVKSNQDNQLVDYVSPLSKYNPLTDNVITDEIFKESEDKAIKLETGVTNVSLSSNYNNGIGEESLLANYDKKSKKEDIQYILLYTSKDLSLTDVNNTTNSYNQNFKYMGLSAEFKTAFGDLNVKKGTYGIEIFIYYSRPRGGSSENREYFWREYRFENNSMVGSIYNFSTFFRQEALFELEGNGAIMHGFSVLFFQDGKFEDANGEKIPTHYNIDNKSMQMPDNIFVRNIDLRFGDDQTEDNIQDKVTIYTNNYIIYDSAQLNDTAIEKRIEVKWMHRIPGTKEFELIDSFDKKVNTEYDLEDCKSRISWYRGTQYTAETPRDDIQEKKDINDKLYNIIKKIQDNSSEDEGKWINEWQSEYNKIADKNNKSMVTTAWNRFKQKNSTYKNYFEKLPTFDEMSYLVGQLELKTPKDYVLYNIIDMIDLTSSGYRTVKSKISRIDTELNKSLSINPTLAGSGWTPIEGGFNVKYIDFLPDRKAKECTIKCVIEYGPKLIDDQGNLTDDYDTKSPYYHKLESNILTLTNITAIPDPGALDNYVDISIEYTDRSNGNYPVYDGTSQKLKDPTLATTKKTLIANLNAKYTNQTYLNGQEILVWKVPKTNTMINLAGTLEDEKEYEWVEKVPKELDENGEPKKERKSITLTENKKMKILNKINTASGGIYNKYEKILKKYKEISIDYDNYYYILYEANKNLPVRNYLRYYLNQDYVKSKTNNTVFCYVIKNNKLYIGATSMTFGIKGSSGTDYTFVLTFGNLVNTSWEVIGPAEDTLTLSDTVNGVQAWREINFDLYDEDGNVVDLTEDNRNDIINLWVSYNPDGYYIGSDPSGKTLSDKTNTLKNYLKWRSNGHGRVAVRVVGSNMPKINVVLQATISSSASVNYGEKTYNLKNIDFTQILPLKIRTDKKYIVKGSNVFYYNDNGALSLGSPTDMILMNHSLEDVNFLNELTKDNDSFKENIKIIEKKFEEKNSNSNIESWKKLPLKKIKNCLKEKDISWDLYGKEIIIKFDSLGRILNYDDLVNTLNGRIESLEQKSDELTQIINNPLMHDYYNKTLFPRAEINAKKTSNETTPIDINESSNRILTWIEEIIDIINELLSQLEAHREDENDFTDKLDKVTGKFIVEVYSDGTKVTGSDALLYYPQCALDSDKNIYTVRAPSFYVDNLSKDIRLICELGGNIYTMPLIMLQNKYGIPMLNRWDGNLLIDSDNNEIMAARMAAGKKDGNNRFTGVIMGDVGKSGDGNAISVDGTAYTTGLYGYLHGEQSFGWKADGTGFIGRSGTGRIDFDGIQGTIKSATYSLTSANSNLPTEGTLINLDQGYIDIWGRGNTWSIIADDWGRETWSKTKTGNFPVNVHLDTRRDSDYFRLTAPQYTTSFKKATDGSYNVTSEIKKNNNVVQTTNLMLIRDGEFYLQTADYSSTSGLKIDLKGGTFDSKGKLTINGGPGSSINFGNGTNYFKIETTTGQNNQVNGANIASTGVINITGATGSSIDFGEFKANPSGGITATSGKIGNWFINGGSLSSYSGEQPSQNYINIDTGSISSNNWGISKNGHAWFADVSITGKNSQINFGGNFWNNDSGFNFSLGSIGLGNANWALNGKGGISFDSNGLKIGGTVNAWGGKIGGWTISANAITSNNKNTTLGDDGTLTINGTTISSKDGALRLGGHSIYFGANDTCRAYVNNNNLFFTAEIETSENLTSAGVLTLGIGSETRSLSSTDIDRLQKLWEAFKDYCGENPPVIATQEWVEDKGYLEDLPGHTHRAGNLRAGEYAVTGSTGGVN